MSKSQPSEAFITPINEPAKGGSFMEAAAVTNCFHDSYSVGGGPSQEVYGPDLNQFAMPGNLEAVRMGCFSGPNPAEQAVIKGGGGITKGMMVPGESAGSGMAKSQSGNNIKDGRLTPHGGTGKDAWIVGEPHHLDLKTTNLYPTGQPAQEKVIKHRV